MTSRSQKSKRGFLSHAKEWEAGREMNVARGMARQASKKGLLGNKAKLALGRASAKALIAATRKKNQALKGK